MVDTLLNQISILDVLNAEEKKRLGQRLVLEQYEMGQTIVRTGEQMHAFYFIVSGKVRRIKEKLNGDEINLGLLHPGEHFGESGLLNNSIIDFTIRASTELQLLKMPKEDFVQMLTLHSELDRYMNQYVTMDSKRLFLQSSTMFANFENKVITSLIDKLTICPYTTGTPVVTEGEPGNAFYILKSGKVDVVKESSGQLLNRLQAGDFIGEMALLKGEPQRATVRTTMDAILFRLSKGDFDELIGKYPQIKEAMLSISSNDSLRGRRILKKKDKVVAEPSVEPGEVADGSTTANKRFHVKGSMPWRRYPVILQQSETDCGPACLSMICKYYGVSIPINHIKSITRTSRSGTSLQGLKEAAITLGFEVEGMRTDITNLHDVHLPAIAHWKGNHYIVVYQVTKEYVYVGDPAIGVEKLTHEQFAENWNGLLLTLIRTAGLKKSGSRGSTLQRYAAYLWPHKRMLVFILLLSVGIQLISLSLPIITQMVIDNVLVNRNDRLLTVLMLAMLSISLVNGFFVFIRQWITSKTALQIDMNMVHAFYKHLLGLPLSFFNERTVGDILTRVNENEKIRQILTSGATNFILDLITIVVYGSLMMYYNVELFFMASVIFPLYIVLIYVISPRMRKNSRKQFQAHADSESTMVEALNYIAAVKALTAEQTVFNQLKDKFKKAMELRLQGTLLWVSAETAGEWIRTLGTISVLYFGSRFVLQGDMTTGQLVAFTVLLTAVTQAISFMIQMMDDLMEARISIERLDDVFQASLEQPDLSQMRTLVDVKGQLSFENVTFRYDAYGNNVLQNVSLDIWPGETVALIGRSGSGKSTLAHLLMNLYQPSSGMIRLDGYDLRTLDAISLRRNIGVVQQDTALFRGTIHDNISFGQPDATMDEMQAAAILAGAHDFISSLPLKYHTMIGDGGMRLSGGQSQRIAIARALLGDPPLLVFDEATSALDTESERRIQNNMDSIVKNRTTLIIAHRLSTVKHADRIVVLDQGTVVESGTHDELLQAKGLYYYLVSQQM